MAVDESGVDETAVEETGIDELGCYRESRIFGARTVVSVAITNCEMCM